MRAKKTVLKVDSKGRTNLNGVRTKYWSEYLVNEDEDGVLTLTPSVTLPASQVEKIRKGLT